MLCEHSSNFIPIYYNNLDIHIDNLHKHIAWDIGALETAKIIADGLDAPLIYANYSRLLLDLNRDLTAQDSIVVKSEDIEIIGNHSLTENERLHRQTLYSPFHNLVDQVIKDKLQSDTHLMVISIHSFTPVYHGEKRPWQIGVLSNKDRRLAETLLRSLKQDPQLVIGDNQPYAPSDGVYHSMGKHGEAHGLPCAMLEIRNDLIADRPSQSIWAKRIISAVESASKSLYPPNTSTLLSAT